MYTFFTEAVMKKIIISAVIFIAVLLMILSVKPASDNEFLRIHIRANSNSQQDQSVKYAVRSEVVEYLTPVLAQCFTKQQSMDAVQARLEEISAIAASVLRANGFEYTATARLCQERFPTRNYGNVTLTSGVYDALILDLGTGTGDNWWCVVYPPLCFVGNESNGTNSVTYKWKIAEIIEQWLNK